MRHRLLIAAALAVLWPGLAFAATTWNPSDKSSLITLSNGNLTAAGNTAATYQAVRATKYLFTGCSSLVYFEFTITNVTTLAQIGLADPTSVLTNFQGGDRHSVAAGNSQTQYNNSNLGNPGTLVSTKTGAIAVDIDNQVWWSKPDVTGSNWNNNASADPATGVGGYVFDVYHALSGITPVAQLRNGSASSSVVGNFGGSAFTGTMPSGYVSWDTATCTTAPVDVTANLAYAPKWVQNTAYSTIGHLGSRVVAGAGLTGSTGTFNNGSTLCLLEATVAGTSSASGDGPTCPGNGNTVSDGSVTWKQLVVVDYVTLTGWAFDAPAWGASTTYHYHDYVTSDSPLRVYRARGTANCTSAGSGGPTGTGAAIADNTCSWDYAVDITYRSGAPARIPFQSYALNGSSGVPNIGMTRNFAASVWHGGVARPAIIPGSNGEHDPIIAQAHTDFTTDDSASEIGLYCDSIVPTASTPIGWPDCANVNYPFVLTIAAAAGEGFASGPGSGALAFNAANGAAIHATTARSTSAAGIPASVAGAVTSGVGFYALTSIIGLSGMQIKSDNAEAWHGGTHGNWNVLTKSIFDAGGGGAAVYTDGDSQVSNSLVVQRSSTAGAGGIVCAYPCALFNNTVIGIGTGANSTGVQVNSSGVTSIFGSGTDPQNNNLILGFAHAFAKGAAYTVGPTANNNGTDLTNSDSGSFTAAAPQSWTLTAAPLPGTSNQFSLVASTEFVNSSTDFRLKAGATSIGKGAAYSFNTNTQQGTLTNALDIIGQARGSAYDIGAWEFSSTVTVAQPIGGVIP